MLPRKPHILRLDVRLFAAVLALLGLLATMVPTTASESDSIYEKSVRPILEARCYECHSAKSEEVKGNLRLDSVEAILKGGDSGPAVIAGDATNSFLIRAIRYQEDDYQMPPAGRLDDEKIKLIETWVKSLKDDVKRRRK